MLSQIIAQLILAEGRFFDLVVRADAATGNGGGALLNATLSGGSGTATSPPAAGSATGLAAYTLRVAGTTVSGVGPGDLHRRSEASDLRSRSFRLARGDGSALTFDLYPSDEYLARFRDETPTYAALGAR